MKSFHVDREGAGSALGGKEDPQVGQVGSEHPSQMLRGMWTSACVSLCAEDRLLLPKAPWCRAALGRLLVLAYRSGAQPAEQLSATP